MSVGDQKVAFRKEDNNINQNKLKSYSYGNSDRYEYNEMPFGMPLRSANPFIANLMYDQPKVGNVILPDINRPGLKGTNASEYKIGIGVDGKNIEIPTVVNGRYLNKEDAIKQYFLTGERFKNMKDPASYSRFYDTISRLGIMINK